MNDVYLKGFIHQFIKFIVPKGKKYLVLFHREKKFLDKRRGNYDYILVVNQLEKEKDILTFLNAVYKLLNANGRIIIVYKNYLHSFFIGLFHSITKSGNTNYNWLSTNDISTFLKLSNFELLLHQPLCLTTRKIPLLTELLNKLVLYLFPFDHLSFLHYIIAVKKPSVVKDVATSIIIPARNEQGNIKRIFHQFPKVGTDCEIIFVEGHSRDNTRREIQKNIRLFAKKRKIHFKLVIQQRGKGKADAVRIGFKHATGDILIIYDADMTIRPSEVLKFYSALITHKGDFINGSRLVYPIESGAMQFLNILGNKFFSILYSWLLGQEIKDTLCGTKALWRKDYLQIRKDSFILEKQDPFGDFYLLIGASKLNLRIVDLPIRYYDRTYGSTNIQRFRNAWELFKLSLLSIKKLKMRLS